MAHPYKTGAVRFDIQARVLALAILFTLLAAGGIVVTSALSLSAQLRRSVIQSAEYALQISSDALRQDIQEVDDLSRWCRVDFTVRTAVLTLANGLSQYRERFFLQLYGGLFDDGEEFRRLCGDFGLRFDAPYCVALGAGGGRGVVRQPLCRGAGHPAESEGAGFADRPCPRPASPGQCAPRPGGLSGRLGGGSEWGRQGAGPGQRLHGGV